jgi:hypothetical protein
MKSRQAFISWPVPALLVLAATVMNPWLAQ